MTQEEYERLVAAVAESARAHGVSPDVARRVAGAVRPSVRLLSSPNPPEQPGACRLGGLPDLPAGVPWPTFANPDYGSREYPYRFLMQINLAAVSRFDPRGLLPPAGHLFFFAHWQDGDRNFDRAGQESKVIFADPNAELRRAGAPTALCDWRRTSPSRSKGATSRSSRRNSIPAWAPCRRPRPRNPDPPIPTGDRP
jgi:hypothetical protein